MTRCGTTFVPATGGVLLACDRPAGLHLVHHDPATGVRYTRSLNGGVFDLCGLFKHRPDRPLR